MSKALSANRRNITILFFSLIVVMLGFGIIIPIMPFYIDAFSDGGVEMGALMVTSAAMQFIFTTIWGQVSDRYGRKPVMMLGVFGNGLRDDHPEQVSIQPISPDPAKIQPSNPCPNYDN